MEWQPIETAPKDGHAILASDPAWHGVPCPMFWNGEEWQHWFRSELYGAYDPTHWMPLPAPPEQDQ